MDSMPGSGSRSRKASEVGLNPALTPTQAPDSGTALDQLREARRASSLGPDAAQSNSNSSNGSETSASQMMRTVKFQASEVAGGAQDSPYGSSVVTAVWDGNNYVLPPPVTPAIGSPGQYVWAPAPGRVGFSNRLSHFVKLR